MCLSRPQAGYREVSRRVGLGVKITPSVKADAYGFGAVGGHEDLWGAKYGAGAPR
jgi:alanine racemase